jgi:hypothetical protein
MAMTVDNHIAHRSARWLRWIARGISFLAAGFWLLILLDILACEVLFGFVCLNWETVLLIGMVAFSFLSVFLAWRKESTGGVVMILWGLVFAAIAFVTSQPYQIYSMLVTGGPFLLAGCLFVASWIFQGTASSLPMQTGNS